jgi:hypothetical protein
MACTYCTAIFLDISLTFNKVRHNELLYKIKNSCPTDLYVVTKSYLSDRTFSVKYGEVITQLKKINSGVSQSSVLEPILYLYSAVHSAYILL